MLKGFLLIILLLGFCSQSLAQTVAIVNGRKITLKEFKEKYRQTEATFNRPTPLVFLEDLVRYEVGVQEAEKRKLRKDPIIKERVRQEMYKLLLEKELSKKIRAIKVTEREMRREYQRNPEVRTSHILVEYRPGATRSEKAIAKKRAQEILDEVKVSKRKFAELVKLYSDDSLSKAAGGDIGYQSKVTAVPTYYNAAKAASVGKVYPKVVQTRFGYHVIKVTGKRKNFEEADRRQVRAVVFEAKRKKIFDKFFVNLKKKYKISLNKSALKGFK